MPTIVFFPLIKYAIFILVTSLFIIVLALLSTSGEMIAANINYTTTNGTSYTVAGQTFTPIVYAFWEPVLTRLDHHRGSSFIRYFGIFGWQDLFLL